ncbi:hypothetical protein [uncultured Clostridium sp.]|uniref:hypothetical protein n=1 Tax=uncultured Clostridium sp. TaxID=59620 RepID=UPI0025D8EB43|nr:hypothetical protein [uncultured Clostridium sp.]
MYESDVAEKVQDTFEEYRETQNYKEAILSTANDLQLSKASVTSYLPYQKGVYFPSTAEKEKISVGAERQRSCRAMKRWKDDLTEENLWWKCIVYDGNKMNSWSAKKALAVCDTQWGRWSDSLHGISFFKKRCMVKKK